MSLGSNFERSRVIVTGGAGFIGSNLVEVLSSHGAIVSVIDNLQSGRWSNIRHVTGISCITADVTARDQMDTIIKDADPDYVFHFAANASVPGSVENPDYDFDANAVGTYNVFRACRGLDSLKRVVLASSAAVYGEPAELPIRETTALRPISPYGFSKLSSEHVMNCHHSVYGVPGVAARIFNAYGPRMARFVILDFLRKLGNNPDALSVLGSGQQVREFTYVRDAVSAFLHLAVHGENGQAYNVSGGAPMSILDLAGRIIAARGLSDTCKIETTGASWIGDAQRWTTDTSRLKELGFTAEWDIDRGLAETIRWFDSEESR
ncbi:MAG: NAD-dependent epimerase/dehydratase family protein [Armatimonadota bacterium]